MSVKNVGGGGAGTLNANGVTDGTSINSALSAGSVKLTPQQTYVIDYPVTVPSNRLLDISGATLTRGAGYPAGPLIRNAARVAQRTVGDGAMTSGSTTLTSNTAAFSAADLGMPIQVLGAGFNSGGVWVPLFGVISTVTSATSVIVDVPAARTVAGATIRIFRRDSNITIIGSASTLVAGGNNAINPTRDDPNPDQATVVFRHIDGFVFDLGLGNVNFTSGNSLMNFGDLTKFALRNVKVNTYIGGADVMHCVGPLNDFIIENIFGTGYDDFVALCASDWQNWADVGGSITNGTVRNIMIDKGGANGVSLYGGYRSDGASSTYIRGILVESVKGLVNQQTPAQTAAGVMLQPHGNSWPGYSITQNITIRDVDVTPLPGSAAVALYADAEDVTIDGVYWNNGISGTGDSLSGRQPIISMWGGNRIKVANVRVPSGGTSYLDVVQIANGAQPSRLVLDSINLDQSCNHCNIVGIWSGLVNGNLDLANINVVGNNPDNRLVYSDVSCNWQTSRLSVTRSDCHAMASCVEIDGPLTVAVPIITFSDCNLNYCQHGVSVPFACTVSAKAVEFYGTGVSQSFVRASGTVGNVRLIASDLTLQVTTVPIDTGGGGSTISMTGNCPVDVTTLTPNDGDTVYNSNATASCGVGSAVYNSTFSKWYALETLRALEGANRRMGVGTLAGGTATIANTSVTANTRIFLSDQGGGVLANLGALQVSSRAAGTSFTVTSSNALDTSNFAYLLIEPG